MTEELFRFKEEKLIFLDIETVALNEELDENSEEFSIFSWKVRDKNNDEELDINEVKDIYKRKAALYPAHAKIVAITVGAIIKGEKILLKTYRGEEEDVLRQFVDDMQDNKGSTFVIWNAPFDMPMIRKRFFINRLQGYLSDAQGNDSMKKPWTLKGILDMMDVWKGITYANDSMNEVAWSMGLPSPKTDMKGSEVSAAFYDGRIDDIVTYNQKDVITLANIYRILTEKEPITEVIIREHIPVTPVLVRIYESKEISEKDKEDLRKLVLVKKPTEEEIEVIRDMVTNLYIQSKMFEADSKAVVEEKTNEVNELIEEICKKK